MGPKFLSLPQDLLVDILECAGPKSILVCEETCRTLYDLSRTTIRLQYQVELFAACKVDAFRTRDDLDTNMTCAQRLTVLNNRETAWMDLRWRDRIEIPLPSFAEFNTLSSGILFLHSDSIAEGSHFAWTALPSIDDPEKHKEVRLQEFTLDFGWRGICIDVAQDFQAYIQQVQETSQQRSTFDIHLRTLSTNAPHPNATFEKIRLALDFYVSEDFDNPIITEVAGDHIGLLFNTDNPPDLDTFILYDWKRAIRKDCPWPSTLDREWDSFTLLSETCVLLANIATTCLDLYRYTDEPGSLRLVVSFCLPTLRSHWMLVDMSLAHEDPLMSTFKLDRSPRRRIHRTNPDESILSFALRFSRIDEPDFPNNLRNYALLIHRDTLLSYESATAVEEDISDQGWGQDSNSVVPSKSSHPNNGPHFASQYGRDVRSGCSKG